MLVLIKTFLCLKAIMLHWVLTQIKKFHIWTQPTFPDIIFHFFLIFLKFIYFEREKERESARAEEGQREKERESQAGSVPSAPNAGLKLTNCEIVTWAESKSPTLNPLSHIWKLFDKKSRSALFLDKKSRTEGGNIYWISALSQARGKALCRLSHLIFRAEWPCELAALIIPILLNVFHYSSF